jgi:hypothetical protein
MSRMRERERMRMRMRRARTKMTCEQCNALIRQARLETYY